ncbi:MAG: ribosomal n-acetyltranseferase [Micavibrio sp.]|nr:ribosomal n-acetyltranseferase [Micavibrio sp.]
MPDLQIVTHRLVIRGHRPGDQDDLLSALEESKTELQKWMNWATPWPSGEQQAEWLHQSVADLPDKARHMRFGVFHRIDGKFLASLGCTTLKPGHFHLSYWARSGETRSGYTTEAVMAFCQHLLYHQGAERIESGCEISNIASQRVLEKAGFVYETDWENKFDNGVARQEKLYAITNLL